MLPIPHALRRPIKRALRLDRRGAVLMYHRVGHVRFDPWDLCVTPARFDEQMACIAAHRAGRPLDAFRDSAPLDTGGRAIAVTFDDGYADNLLHALPALERHDVPATIFIVTERIGCGREFWWDGLTRAIFTPDRLPARLDLRIGDLILTADVPPDGAGDDAADMAFRADLSDPETPRQKLYIDIWTRLFPLAPEIQDAAVEAILAWAGTPEPVDPASLPLTRDQLGELARHPLITLGNHTGNHQPLDRVSVALAREEIDIGQSRLEAMTGIRAQTFSFPYGKLAPSAIGAVKASGAALACTSIDGIVTPLTARYRLPRIQIMDQSGADFLHRLRDDYALMEA